MKRSEYDRLVENVVNATRDELQNGMRAELKKGLSDGIIFLVNSIPEVSARVISDILVQTGSLSFDEDSEAGC